MEKLKLFPDDDQESNLQDKESNLLLDEKIFNEKQLSEKQTAKLIQLKSRLAHDPRFKIDDRFVEDEEINEDSEKSLSEKEKNLSILQEVIGKPVTSSKQLDSKHSPQSTLFTPRFDPTKEECKVFELNQEENGKRKLSVLDTAEIDKKIIKQKKKFKNVDKINEKIKNLNLNDNSCYYETEANLKDLFGGKTENFTLSSILDEPTNMISEQNKQSTSEPVGLKPLKYVSKENPFQYDSSDSEDGEKENDKIQIQIPKQVPLNIDFKGFFFDSNDSRLMSEEDQFYKPELVKKVCEGAPERLLLMMKALSLRKKFSVKNKKSAEKYTAKQKLQKRFITQRNKRKRFFNKRWRVMQISKKNKIKK